MKTVLMIMSLGLMLSLKNDKVPSIMIKKLDGTKVNTMDVIKNDGKPIVISFWATWCKPCKKELDAISENYEDW